MEKHQNIFRHKKHFLSENALKKFSPDLSI